MTARAIVVEKLSASLFGGMGVGRLRRGGCGEGGQKSGQDKNFHGFIVARNLGSSVELALTGRRPDQEPNSPTRMRSRYASGDSIANAVCPASTSKSWSPLTSMSAPPLCARSRNI